MAITNRENANQHRKHLQSLNQIDLVAEEIMSKKSKISLGELQWILRDLAFFVSSELEEFAKDPKFEDTEILFSPIESVVINTEIAKKLFGNEEKSSMSTGERQVCDYLNDRRISFEREKTFASCRHKSLLRFDFFISKHNAVIEYHGKQHYEPVEYFGGKESHDSVVIRDNIKKEWCAENGYTYIEIPYNKTVDDVLKDYAWLN